MLSSFNLHGSLLVQSLLRFTHPDLIVNSLLSLTTAELQAVCCDSAGSHVITAFVNSPTVTQRSQLYAQLRVMPRHCLHHSVRLWSFSCLLFRFTVILRAMFHGVFTETHLRGIVNMNYISK